MMNLNRGTLFAYLRTAPFGGRLTENQVKGTEAILTAYENIGGTSLPILAYILATAFHETGGRMMPVREGFGKSDAESRRKTAKYKYGKPDPKTGHVYYGRGHVQLTWAENYKTMGRILDLPLYEKPDLALELDISAQILVEGMMRGQSNRGDFTGQPVEQYFNGAINDPVGARRVVNGTDKAKLIADHYKAILGALEAAAADVQPEDVTEKAATPDAPNMFKDKTTWGAATAFVGAGGFSFMDNINNGWTFAALVFIVLAGIGIWLFASGRYSIIKKAGA